MFKEKMNWNSRYKLYKLIFFGVLIVMTFFPLLGTSSNAFGDELKILTTTHFVPKSDAELKRQVEAFAKMKGITARLDTVHNEHIPTTKAAEAQAKSGHDIIMNYGADASLYENLFEPVDDVVNELGKKYGGYIPMAADSSKVNGVWRAVPWYYYSWPVNFQKCLVEKVGGPYPDTWENLLAVGRKLKAQGKYIGFAISHSRDGNSGLHHLLWSFGASSVGKDGETITINSPETAKALEYLKTLYKDAMTPDVLSWDDMSNNRAFQAGHIWYTYNSPSIFFKANSQKLKVQDTGQSLADCMDHEIPPAGPAGRFLMGDPLSLSIWKFSKNKKLAKEFLLFLFDKQQYDLWLQESVGYNVPFLRGFENHKIFTAEWAKYIKEMGQYIHPLGYPGPITKEAQVVFDLNIIPDMAAYVVTGNKTIPEAMKWAEIEIKSIYKAKKK